MLATNLLEWDELFQKEGFLLVHSPLGWHLAIMSHKVLVKWHRTYSFVLGTQHTSVEWSRTRNADSKMQVCIRDMHSKLNSRMHFIYTRHVMFVYWILEISLQRTKGFPLAYMEYIRIACLLSNSKSSDTAECRELLMKGNVYDIKWKQYLTEASTSFFLGWPALELHH